MQLIRKLRFLLSKLRAVFFDVHAVKSYSQEGEDMILQRIFHGKNSGFYVDVGAHHPSRFSNTNVFYKRGWRGINIEPNPEAFSRFASKRSRDTNLQLGISEVTGELTYYEFDEPALNTFDAKIVESRLADTPYKLISTKKVKVERLDRVLNDFSDVNVRIDFLSIDVEGFDFSVLKSNDWQRFRPRVVLVEALETSLEEAMHGEIFNFMKKNGYQLFAKTYNTLIFKELPPDLVTHEQ